ncbi:hypothetical protein [Roseovarius sp.]
MGRKLAYGFVSPWLTQTGTAFEMDMCGEMIPVRVIAPRPYDPEMRLPRG